MSDTPNAVLSQAQRADELIAAQGNPQSSAPEKSEVKEAVEAPQSQPEPEVPVVPEPPKPLNRDDDPEYWKHRFKIMEGKYNAEIGPLREENKSLKQQIEHGNQADNTLSKQIGEAVSSQLTAEEIADYGEDLINMVRKVASEVVNRTTDEKLQSIDYEVQSIKEEKAHDASAVFWSELRREVSDWREINQKELFHNWLNEFDPFSGMPRQTLLEDAQKKLDHGRVIQIFNAFKQTAPAATPTIPEEKVVPTQSNHTAKPASQDRSFSREEIKAFYRKKSSGGFDRNPEEAAALEREIFLAQQKGLIY